jgi:hypothetical protein
MRFAILSLCLVLLVIQQPSPKLRFVQPVRTLILSGPRGVWFNAQAFVPRHPDNRAVKIAWDGEGCSGSASRSLDGENESAIFPLSPLKVEATPGICAMSLATYGAGGKMRERVTLDVKVCGGEDGCF